MRPTGAGSGPAPPARWHDIPAERYLSGLGIAMDRLRHESCSSGRLPTPIGWEVWLTGFALGVTARVDSSAVVSGAANPDPAVIQEAMGTIGPGGLCHRYSAEDIAELHDTLAETAWQGLRLGDEYGARILGGPTMSPAAPAVSIEVTGADTPLRDCVVRGLLDHGWRVVTSAGEEHSGTVVVDVSRAPLGEIAIIRKTAGRRVIQVGDLYGPGCSPDSRIGAIVFAAAMGIPHTVAEDPATLVRPLHVDDLITALNRLVRDSIAGAATDFCRPRPRRLDEIARRVHRAVRPIHIEFVSDAPGSVVRETAVAEAVGNLPPDTTLDDESGCVDMDFGLRTFAQWLAYEYP
jgi:hypothetical protein